MEVRGTLRNNPYKRNAFLVHYCMFSSYAFLFLILFSTAFIAGCCVNCPRAVPPTDGEPPETLVFYTVQVVNTFPHDPQAFTQGLAFADGFLYEGTGMHGASCLKKVALETGETLQRVDLGRSYFGEGIALQGDRIIQLTWKNQTAFIYDRKTFESKGKYSYLGEGWGLTFDGSRFILSDGTAQLRFLDKDSFQPLSSLYVRDGQKLIKNLNELEFIDGKVFANIWREERIAIIDPETGYVTAWIDLTGLLTKEERKHVDVLNGIAWDASGERLFVTGKYWPKLFEIQLVEQRSIPYPQ